MTAATIPMTTEPRESRYEIVEQIGRGGMGVVFRARDKRLGREVALKRLPENLRDHPSAVQLFLREARAAAALNHPNIVTIYDADQEDGTFFITMELLEGDPLHVILRRAGGSRRATARGSACRSARASSTRTSGASCTATSRPRTCSSRAARS